MVDTAQVAVGLPQRTPAGGVLRRVQQRRLQVRLVGQRLLDQALGGDAVARTLSGPGREQGGGGTFDRGRRDARQTVEYRGEGGTGRRGPPLYLVSQIAQDLRDGQPSP